MPQTPDRFHGEADEEGLVFENRTPGDDPTVVGGMRFVNGAFSLRDSIGLFNPRSGASSIFGQAYQYAASEADTTTSSNTPTQKLSLATPVVAAGDYVVYWHALLRTTSANKNFQARIQQDNVTNLSLIESRVAIANQHYIFTGVAQVTLTAAAHTFDIDWNSTVGSATVISLARIAIWRVV
jgi:hypothetical protein